MNPATKDKLLKLVDDVAEEAGAYKICSEDLMEDVAEYVEQLLAVAFREGCVEACEAILDVDIMSATSLAQAHQFVGERVTEYRSSKDYLRSKLEENYDVQ
jgi:hypothetical protein